MKVLLIAILLVCGICTASSQNFGVQAGVRLNTSSIDYPDVNINRKAGFEGGIFYRRPIFMEHFGLRASLLYFNQEFSLKNDMGGNTGITYHFSEDNLKLPLVVEWQAGFGKLKPLVKAGLYSSYCVSGKIKDRESTNSLDYRKSIHRIDYGLTFGFGVCLRSRIALNATYDHGFARRELGLGDRLVSVSSRGCSFCLNYLF